MQETVFVSVKNLSRSYGPIQAVNGISFELKQGEVLGFLGPNGAGKSTTMQMLTGNLAPSAGQILINGIDLLTRPKQAKAEIGYLPEQPPLYKDLTVDEYLSFCARLHGIARDKLKSHCDHAKQRCGLADVGRRLIANLSKGYQQRVGIAQAIIHSPSIVILDEPTVGLDPIQIREIRQLIRDLADEHSVILSTHILPEVQVTCDRVQIINNGELVMSDTLANLDRQAQAKSLILGLTNPPAIDVLQQIEHVSRVEPLTEHIKEGADNAHLFRLHFDPNHNPAGSVSQLAVEKGWGLAELTPERRSLEEIFVQITGGDEFSPDTKAVREENEGAAA